MKTTSTKLLADETRRFHDLIPLILAVRHLGTKRK